MSTLFIIIAVAIGLLALATLIDNFKLKKKLEEQEATLKKLRIENFTFTEAFKRNVDKFEDHWGDAR